MACAALMAITARADNPDLVRAAREQVGVTVIYDPAYRKLSYPGGDFPAERGVCTDVVVRALRAARGIDLQKRVHDDLAANWDSYPHPWRSSKPDPNIDHRRVPNLMKYFERAGFGRNPSRDAATYLPGDVVAWDLGRGILHIGVVSDRKAGSVPLVIHNIGAGAREEDILFRFTIIGHYRLPPTNATTGSAPAPVASH
jgi:uncharacterized protein YijF (DUF1287 family)